MRLVVAPVLVAVVAAFTAGCAGDEESSTDASALEGVSWVVTAGIDLEGWEATAPTMTFDGTRVGGSTGCNSYGGTYEVDGSTLELGMLAQTLIGCPSPAREVEAAFTAALENVAGWSIEDDELVLSDADDGQLLRFEPATIVGSWEVTSLLSGDALTSPIAGSEITATFTEDGALSGSAGCNNYTASYTTDGDAIEITPPAATRKLCPEPAGVMEQEASYLEALERAVRYRFDGPVLGLSSAGGARVVAFARD